MDGRTKYAKSGGAHIAYRVFGGGPGDLILVPGTVSHVELYWELPANAYLLKRLARFARVIVFDKRGQGLSDRVAEQTIEERVGDMMAVLDAVGSRRAAVYGWSEGGQLSLTFAATYPERVSRLVLYGAYASIKSVSPERFAQLLAAMESHWGEGILIRINAPSRVKDRAFMQWAGRLERAVASPSGIVALMRANYAIEVGHLLPSLRVPTLILHREGDALVPVESGRYLARTIPGATYVELPGCDHMLQALDQDVLDMLLDEIELFVTGREPRAERRDGPAVARPPDTPDAAAYAMSLAADVPGRDPLDDAIAELERCREILDSDGTGQALAGLVARAEGIAAAARGAWRESEAQFLKAAETFRRHGMVWQEAQTFQSWGLALRGGANRHAAIEKLETAIASYRRHHGSHSGDTGGESTAGNGAAAPESPHQQPAQPAASGAVFRREGEYWTLAWQAHVVRVKHGKGLHYIHYLLAHPGRQVLACELAADHAAPGSHRASVDAGHTAADLGDAGALLDTQAREQYRRRRGELRQELADAVQLNDVGRAARVRAELESLDEHLAAALGLGGRNRKAASHRERARLMVTKAIKVAIARIREGDPSMGRYLAMSIKTGNCCAYAPEAIAAVRWEL